MAEDNNLMKTKQILSRPSEGQQKIFRARQNWRTLKNKKQIILMISRSGEEQVMNLIQQK